MKAFAKVDGAIQRFLLRRDGVVSFSPERAQIDLESSSAPFSGEVRGRDGVGVTTIALIRLPQRDDPEGSRDDKEGVRVGCTCVREGEERGGFSHGMDHKSQSTNRKVPSFFPRDQLKKKKKVRAKGDRSRGHEEEELLCAV